MRYLLIPFAPIWRFLVWSFGDAVIFISDWTLYQSNDIHAWASTAPTNVLVRATVRRCPYVRDRAARELVRRRISV